MSRSLLRAPLMAVLIASGVVAGYADDLLRLEELSVPQRPPAGSAIPISARFTVLEPVRDGWRVSAELAPVAGGRSYSVGPEYSQFNATTPPGTTRTAGFSIPVPEDAVPGRYRVIVDHYSNPDGPWVHVRYVDRAGKPLGVVLGEIEITPPLSPLPLPAPQRRLRPGEIHRVFEAEDFLGMAGHGEDIGVVQGWTWYAWHNLSRTRAAINNTGAGAIHQLLSPPLPPGAYKVFVRSLSPFAVARVSLGNTPCEAELPRSNWNEVGTVKIDRPARRLTLEAVRKLGDTLVIDSVYVTNDLATGATNGWDPSRQFLPTDARPAKRGRTIYTEAYMRAMRERVERYPQLRREASKAVREGRRLLKYDDRRLWQASVDTTVKREYFANEFKGCPVCGPKIMDFGRYSWLVDPLEHPYKVQCPVCRTYFPSNDFAGGDMTSGEYPDDGTGFKRGDDVYHFIGCYAH